MMEPPQASTASAHSCATLYSGSGVASARITAEGFAAAIIFAALAGAARRQGRLPPCASASRTAEFSSATTMIGPDKDMGGTPRLTQQAGNLTGPCKCHVNAGGAVFAAEFSALLSRGC